MVCRAKFSFKLGKTDFEVQRSVNESDRGPGIFNIYDDGEIMGSLKFMFDETEQNINKSVPEDTVHLADGAAIHTDHSSLCSVNKNIQVTSQRESEELNKVIPEKFVADSFALPGKKKPPDKY